MESKKPPKRVTWFESASDAAVYQVEESGADDDQAGIEKHAALVVAVGIAKQKRGVGVDHQSHHGQERWD
jgi:hypothetical protein